MDTKGQLTMYVIVGIIALIVLAGSLVFLLDFLSDNFLYVIVLAVLFLIYYFKKHMRG